MLQQSLIRRRRPDEVLAFAFARNGPTDEAARITAITGGPGGEAGQPSFHLLGLFTLDIVVEALPSNERAIRSDNATLDEVTQRSLGLAYDAFPIDGRACVGNGYTRMGCSGVNQHPEPQRPRQLGLDRIADLAKCSNIDANVDEIFRIGL